MAQRVRKVSRSDDSTGPLVRRRTGRCLPRHIAADSQESPRAALAGPSGRRPSTAKPWRKDALKRAATAISETWSTDCARKAMEVAVRYEVNLLELSSLAPSPPYPESRHNQRGLNLMLLVANIGQMASHQRRWMPWFQRRSWTVQRLGPDPTSPVWTQV
jgi:hypothetical protein